MKYINHIHPNVLILFTIFKDICWVHIINKSLKSSVKIKFDLNIPQSNGYFYNSINKKIAEGTMKNFEEIISFLKNKCVVLEEDYESVKMTTKRIHVLKRSW